MGVNEKQVDLLESLKLAITDFEKTLNADFTKYDAQEIDWIKNAQIQKFEFCVELTWKTAKVYLETLQQKIYTPKSTTKDLFLYQIIEEDVYLSFMSCIDDRNKLSHIYKLEMFELILSEIPKYFQTIFEIHTALSKIRFV